MDRSFLSQAPVIAASRAFVCVRLLTYEDETEGAFLKSLVRTRSQELENSSFAILAPDGKTKLVPSGRSIRGIYPNPQAMADGMAKLAESLPPKAAVTALPLVTDVRLALDVASSDGQPLVIIVGNEHERTEWQTAVAQHAWSREFVGRFVYVSTGDAKSLSAISDAKANTKLLVVQPDAFGLKGRVLTQTSRLTDVATTLTQGAQAFVHAEKEFRSHVRDGIRAGVFWETKTPVTDPGEIGARERARKK